MSGFVGEFTLDPSAIPAGAATVTTAVLPSVGHGAQLLHGVLDAKECRRLAAAIPTTAWVPVGRDGMKPGHDPRRDPVGSWRATAYSSAAADVLWQRIAPLLESEIDSDAPTDLDGRRWRAIGVNPLLRFIRYVDGGLLIPHYDAPYLADEHTRTLQSLVIYLDSTAAGGRTRFLHDPQLELPFADRDHSDWPREAEPHEIRAHVDPVPGAALVFPHRLLHDSEPVRGGEKLLCRTDLLYSAA